MASLSKTAGDSTEAAKLIYLPGLFFGDPKVVHIHGVLLVLDEDQSGIGQPGSCTCGNGKASVYALVSIIAVLSIFKSDEIVARCGKRGVEASDRFVSVVRSTCSFDKLRSLHFLITPMLGRYGSFKAVLSLSELTIGQSQMYRDGLED